MTIFTLHQAEDIQAQFICSHEGTPAPTERKTAPMEETEDEEEEKSGKNKVKKSAKSQDPFNKNRELLELVLVKGLTNPRGMRVRVSRVRVRVKIFIPL